MSQSDLVSLIDSGVSAVLVGSASAVDDLVSAFKARGTAVSGNPDIRTFAYSELKVDNVRDEILSFASLKPLGEKKYVFISFSKANEASQNALLKAVEDSMGATVFYFIVESAGHIIPTLRSRCIVVRLKGDEHSEAVLEAEDFLSGTYEARLKTVEKMAGYITKTQDRVQARQFLNSLLRIGRGRITPTGLRDILDAIRFLRMQGSSAKAVLGHLAVTLPRVSSRA